MARRQKLFPGQCADLPAALVSQVAFLPWTVEFYVAFEKELSWSGNQ